MRYFASENRSSGEGASRSGEAFGSARARAAQGGWRPEAVVEALLESVDCGILLAQADGDLWAINQRLAEIWGQDAERVRELRHLDEVVAQIAPQFANSESVAGRWRQRFDHAEAAWDELELVKPKRKILERYARPVLDEYKRPVGWLEIYRDVSEGRQMQSRLFLSERLAVLGQMLTGVAHELNNPLTSILGYAQLVQGRARDCEAEARHILEEAERARRIARNLLLFARGGTPERNRIHLNDVVEHTVAIRGYELRLENIRVELDLDRGLPEVIADVSQIQQALLNLMLNAEQAIRQFRENGTIWIRTRQASAGRIALEVADDGPGVPPEAILHVFDPFFTTKPAGVGTGLGLSILYGIVHQHGGEVSVENRPGGGAVFTMELPSSAPAAGNEKPYLIRSPGLGQRSALAARKEARILVLEDEPTVVRLIADVLREEGHLVDTVLDSREGLELARTRRYDLVICDLRMPHVDGRAFYRELVREQNPLQHRLIFVTGDTLGARTVDFLRACGLPYLAKPFRVEELKEMVGKMLEKTGKPSSKAEMEEQKRPEGHQSDGEHGNSYEH
jgi:signal transduction histidine kinase/DNA-binding NarL/FixJ family response regulator